MRLRSSLLLVSFATAAPLMVLALLATALVVENRHESLERDAKTRNRAAIGAVDAELRGAITTLQALTIARSLSSDNLQEFHADARAVLATQPLWNNVLLHDAEGRQLVNARLPWGTALLPKPMAPRSMERAARTLQPAIDDLTSAPLLGNQLGIPVRVPVVRDGKAVYILTGVMTPQAFQKLLADEKLPAGWISGLVDSQGRLIARVPETPPGTMASKIYLEHSRTGDEGWFRSTTLEGMDVYSSFQRSALTGWTIGYAIPAPVVTSTALRAAWLMGAGIALSIGVAVLIGVWLTRRIAGPMSQLAASAKALGGGTAQLPLKTSIDEVAQLAHALADAANAIGERDRRIERTTAELREHADELHHANERKSRFLALLSHELRNPLAPLRNGLALLRMQREPAALAHTQAMMERQVAHLARLIDDLLDVSRIDREQLELRRELMSLETVVDGAVEAARPGMDAKRQSFELRRLPAPVHVNGDPVRLAQVFTNLLNNATKFTPVGGRIEIALAVDGGDAIVFVQDSGIGFQPAENRRIFDLFVQLDATRGWAGGGLGIGLTLARSLVEMHGGRIEAHSAGAGAGATFTVRLPRAATLPGPVVETPVARAATRRQRILVADDNADAAESLSQFLAMAGHDVRGASDAVAALGVARTFRPQVAFLDLDMPGMNGYELAATLRAQPWAHDLRLVAVTGMGRAGDRTATRDAGFSAHLTKPASPEDVLRLASGPVQPTFAMLDDRPGDVPAAALARQAPGEEAADGTSGRAA
jgi:signal transduction histidine kinase/CheY-like chemotaxis protein